MNSLLRFFIVLLCASASWGTSYDLTARTDTALSQPGKKMVFGFVDPDTIAMDGTSSGRVTIKAAATAGTWTWLWPASGGTNGYPLTTNGSGTTAWSLLSLTAGVTGTLPVANGGTNASSASITAFNNITGYTAAGATGTTSTNLVFSTSPTLTTPNIGAATGTSLTLTGGLNASDGSPTNVAYANAGGSFFVDGTGTTPTTGANGAMLVYDADNSAGALTVKLNENTASLTGADVFMIFSDNNATEGSIAGVASGTIIFNTFTGGHYAQLKDDKEVEKLEFGMLVSATGELMNEVSQSMEYLPIVTRSAIKNDPAVYGVWASRIAVGVSADSAALMLAQRDSTSTADSLRTRAMECRKHEDIFNTDLSAKLLQDAAKVQPANPLKRTGTSADYAQGNPTKDTHQIIALGTGRVLVTDEGGDIAVGDLLSSSSMPGLAMRQADDLVHSYTVAKATVAVSWDTVAAVGGIKKKLIPCTYK